MIYVVTTEQLKAELMTEVQKRIKAHDSQTAAARAWCIPQSTVNEIANGKDRWSCEYLMDVILKDGGAIKVWVHE